MPANNRVHSSAALQTHGIWQSAIGYDPYAPDQKSSGGPGSSAAPGGDDASAGTGDGHGSRASEQNTYDSFQGLLALARLTGSNADEARGSCRKCGRVGHLAFQCRNMLALKEEPVASSAVASAHGSGGILSPFADKHGLGRVAKRKDKDANARNYSTSDNDGDDDSEDDASDVSDSSEDSEMERYIREKFGRNPLKSSSSKSKTSSKKELGESNKRKKRSHSSSRRSRSKKDVSDDNNDGDSSEEEERRKKKQERKKQKQKEGDPSPWIEP